MNQGVVQSKICCIGSNLESYIALSYLIDNGCEIAALITLPEHKGENVSDYVNLHPLCKENSIPVITTQNVNSEITISKLRAYNFDYLFTLGWSQIFKEKFIDCFSKFIIGTHPSKLPFGRGRAPVPWTIIDEVKNSAVSFFKIDQGIDTGKLIFQLDFEVPHRPYAMDIYDLVAERLGVGYLKLYNSIKKDEEIHFKNQSNKGATHRSKRGPTDGLIVFDKDINYNDKIIRAVSEPFPGAYCYYKDKKIIFWRVELDLDNNHFGTLGQILRKNERGVLVQFLDGTLWLEKPTDHCLNPIALKEFKIGDKLGYNIQDEIFYLRQQLKA